MAGTVSPAGLTPRLLARIHKDFPADVERVIDMLEGVESGRQDRERSLDRWLGPA